MEPRRYSRREFIKLGAAAGTAAIAGGAYANRHPAPRPTSLGYQWTLSGLNEGHA